MSIARGIAVLETHFVPLVAAVFAWGPHIRSADPSRATRLRLIVRGAARAPVKLKNTHGPATPARAFN
jgi:hypothetical protein